MSRYLVVASLFVLSLITYIDRAAISSAKGAMSAELALSDQAMGAVFSAFALGYAIAQIPAGWFADRFGPRLALSLVVALWSLLTALTGAAKTLNPLLAIRFLFGVAEAGAFPGSARAIFNWLPVSNRGRANGIMFSGTRIGAAVAFPLMAWMMSNWDWRNSFYLLAIPGLLWALGWTVFFRNHPSTPVEVAVAGEAPQYSFRQVFTSRVMALNMFQYFSGNFTFFICLSWMLPYLQRRYELDLIEAASYSMIPLLAGGSAQWIAGFLVDALYSTKYRPWSRRAPAIIGFVLASVGVFLVSFMESPTAAVLCFAVATFGADMTISPSWAYCIDIGGKNSGAVSGSMNMLGNFGSFVSANAFPFLFGLTGTAFTYFAIAAVLNGLSVVCWLLMKPELSLKPKSSCA